TAQRADEIELASRDNQIFDRNEDTGQKGGGPVHFVRIVLPLRVTGLPAGAILHADRSFIRLVMADGSILFRGTGQVFDVRAPTDGSDCRLIGQTMLVPQKIYERATDKSLRLEADYSLTLLRARTLPRMAAIEGRLTNRDVGQC